MKIAVCSDLHLEFEDIDLKNEAGAEVLILSGDIIVAADLDEWNEVQAENGFSRYRSVRYHEFFQRCCKAYSHVIYVAGNHEHYHGDFSFTLDALKLKLEYLENLHILDKEVFKLGNYTFVGSTLWTDMNNSDPLTLLHIKSMMNDFRVVKNSNRYTCRKVPLYGKNEDGTYKTDSEGNKYQVGMKMKEEPSKFSPVDAVEEFRKSFDYIKFIVSEAKPDEKVIVVGHHTPSWQSCAEHYKHDTLMNGGYHNKLDEYIEDHPQIVLWTHGHTHELFDYNIGMTRIVCNPRGYAGWDDCASKFKLKVIEI